jgi:hypothetical protein
MKVRSPEDAQNSARAPEDSDGAASKARKILKKQRLETVPVTSLGA